MVSLFIINFDEIIFELIQRGQFDVNQIESTWEFFVCLKATAFRGLFDIDQTASEFIGRLRRLTLINNLALPPQLP